jgi:long-chain fatty acid transport protein
LIAGHTTTFTKIHDTQGGETMIRKRLVFILCASFLSALYAGGPAWAGGAMLYQFGSPDVGLAAAGYAARAQDASTVFTNPAGMSRLEKSQVLGGLQGLYGNVKFSPNSATTVSGGDGGVAVGWLPGGSFFVVQKLDADWSIGFGSLSYFGLSQKFDGDWVGRYYVQKSSLMGMTLTPAASYRVNNWLYLGAGFNLMYGILDDQVAVNNITGPDGQLKYSDKRWGYGANLGVLAEPKPGTRFGLTYLSEVKLDFSAVPEFSGLNAGLQAWLISQGLYSSSMDLGMTVPQMVMFSAYHELNPQWAIMANIGWQQWSRFGEVDVQINSSDPRSLTVHVDLNDTWHAALGAQYRHSPKWMFSGGVAYDSSAVNDANRSVTVPMGQVWGFALGAQYAISPSLALGAAYELAWVGNMPVNQVRGVGPFANTVAGGFDNTSFSFFALNLKWTY